MSRFFYHDDMVIDDVHMVIDDVDMVIDDVHMVIDDVDMVIDDVHMVLDDVDMVIHDVGIMFTGSRNPPFSAPSRVVGAG